MRRLAPLIALVALAAAVAAPPADALAPRAAVFSGSALWVGGDGPPPPAPARVVAVAEQRGVPVVFVEAASGRSRRDVVDRPYVRELVRLGQAAGLRIVPWYRAGLTRPALDRRRLAAAIRLGGDGTGIGIAIRPGREASRDAARANALAAWARANAPRRPLAVVVTRNATAAAVPYADLQRSADAFAPFCGPPRGAVRVGACVDAIRRGSGDPDAQVHVVVGIRGRSGADLEAAARDALDAGATGFSLFDLAATRPAGWAALDRWAAG